MHPYIAKVVYAHETLGAVMVDYEGTFGRRCSDMVESHTGSRQDGIDLFNLGRVNLCDKGRILGKKNLYKIFLSEHVGIKLYAAVDIGKCHFKKRGHKTAGRNVVCRKEQTFLYELLHSLECIYEIGRIGNSRSLCTKFAERLSEGRTAETEVVSREVYII